ncbi:MAG: hypothetical protein GC201_08130 [Alphaproteobacteria bacterium]|nr:hypothetical protein [Alphaproteobacteria bacterium]
MTRYRSRAHTPSISPNDEIIRYFNRLYRRRRQLHNHPSGDPHPSRADIEMTKQVVAAAGALGIVVHDHLVIGRGTHASFKSMGLL